LSANGFAFKSMSQNTNKVKQMLKNASYFIILSFV